MFGRTSGSIQPIRELGLGGEGGKGAAKETDTTNETRNKTKTENVNMATMLEKLTRIQMDVLIAQQNRLSKRLSLQKEKLETIGGSGPVVNIQGVGNGRIINAPDKNFLNRRKRSMMATGLKHQLFYSDGFLTDIEAVVMSIIDVKGRIRSEAVVEPYLRVATHAYRLVEKSLLISVLQRTVDAAKNAKGGVDGPGHFARTLRALVKAGITRVIGQWVSDLVRGPKEFSATEFLKNILSASIDLPVTFMALKMSKASRTLISAAKNWEDEEVKRLGKRLKAKWHSQLRNDQSEEEAQALSDRMDKHLQKHQNSNLGGQKLIPLPRVDESDAMVGSISTKIDNNSEPSIEVKATPMETLSGEGSGGEEGEGEDTYLKPILPPAKRPQPMLVAPQARPTKRVMKMKVLTDDVTEGSSTAADTTSGPSIVSPIDSHALHDTRQQPQPDGSTDSSVTDANLHITRSDGKGEDKGKTTIGGGGLQEYDRMKDDDIGGERPSVLAETQHVNMDTPSLQLPEREGGDGLPSSSTTSKVLAPVKSVVQPVAPMEDVKPKSAEVPPSPLSSEVVTKAPPPPTPVGFGKGLGSSDSERHSTVLPSPSPPLVSSADDMATPAPKAYALNRSSMKGSREFDRVGSVSLILQLDRIYS